MERSRRDEQVTPCGRLTCQPVLDDNGTIKLRWDIDQEPGPGQRHRRADENTLLWLLLSSAHIGVTRLLGK